MSPLSRDFTLCRMLAPSGIKRRFFADDADEREPPRIILRLPLKSSAVLCGRLFQSSPAMLRAVKDASFKVAPTPETTLSLYRDPATR